MGLDPVQPCFHDRGVGRVDPAASHLSSSKDTFLPSLSCGCIALPGSGSEDSALCGPLMRISTRCTIVQSPHAGCGGWFASIDIGCLRTGALTECHFWRAHSDTL
jgi:hypothetical protein